jgi:myo-inositol-1-phosphate synthase
MAKIGAWLIGARGTLASTAVVGARAIAHNLVSSGGLVTELPEIAALPLARFEEIVFGGWDVTSQPVLERARTMAGDDRAFPGGLVAALEDDLLAADAHVRPGVIDPAVGASRGRRPARARRGKESLEAVVKRLGEDLERFRSDHKLDTVIVVNVASTEAPIDLSPAHERLEGLDDLIHDDRAEAFRPSMLYAYAALAGGCPYVNFTPSSGIDSPGLQQLGRKQGVPFFGSDGKTGETLVKTVLAPLFRCRNLEVLSWDGYNILGGGDGEVLSDALNRESKLRSKSGVLSPILGYRPQSRVSIDYVPALGNWKTAWDHILFRGFLGTKMTAQIIWQGCDAILAAPLVLDLVRLAEYAHRRGESGPMPHLACFFKKPMGVPVHSFTEQFDALLQYVDRHRAAFRPVRG